MGGRGRIHRSPTENSARYFFSLVINDLPNNIHYGGRSHSEESDDESDTGEKEERETKDKVEGCVQEGHADCRTERGR